MEDSLQENYLKAGKIAGEVREYGKTLIKQDASLLEICDKVEQKISELKAKPAFPVQISLNQTAAHYCPEEDDKTILTDQLVSLDVGVHIDGCIGDTAVTVDLSGKYSDLIKASDKALENALKIIRPEITLSEIGKEIEDTIKSFGFNPVKNLSGHGLGLYNIHTKPTIPNYDNKDKTKLKVGDVIAIEPFATTGVGMIHEKGHPTVFSLTNSKSVRLEFVKDILKQIESYNGLPFATRWLTKRFSKGQVDFALAKLRQQEIITAYPPLVEISNGVVSQSEHSVIVGEKVKVLTKI